jgi:hypothetical protein
MSKDKPALPANALIRLAEKADGRRGVAQQLVRIGTGDAARYDVLTDEEIKERRAAGESIEVLMPIEAPHENRARREREKETVITIKVPGAKPRTYNAGEVDAVFLTESAVRKFVLGYYARVLPTEEYSAMVRSYYEGDDPAFAMVHLPSSDYEIINAD